MNFFSGLVPLRAIFEALGASIEWNDKTQSIVAKKDNLFIYLQIGSTKASKNGNDVTLEVPPQIINEHTMVPVRFISESLGSTVSWDGNTHSVIITSSQDSGNTNPPSSSTSNDLTTEDVGKLSNRIVYVLVKDQNNQPVASGSGFVVDPSGLVLTNYHVIKDAYQIDVQFTDQRTFTTTKLLNVDPDNDLALLDIGTTGLSAVTLGDSSNIVLGEQVVAIGSPLGFQNSLTTGVISATSRIIDGHDYIQISTPIDHGSSGGALFNMKGEVIGVTSAGYTSQANINLAIPSNVVKAFLSKPRNPISLGQNSTNSNVISTTDLTNYLNKNYSSLTFKGSSFNLQYNVIMSNDNKEYLIYARLTDPKQFSNWMSMQNNDETVLPSYIRYLSDSLHNNLGLSNTFISCFLDYYPSTYPTVFPAKSIIKTDNGYRVLFNFIYGYIDYQNKTFYYELFPDDDNLKTDRTLPLN